jgi:hypothetical protein
LASQPPSPAQTIATTEGTDTAPEFSFQRVMQFAAFLRPGGEGSAGTNSEVMPQEIVQLSESVNNIVTSANELNIDDPAQVTSKKAYAILESLRPFDRLLGTAESKDLVSSDVTAAMRSVLGQLGVQANNLIQFGATSENIKSIQHLAGQLGTAYGGVASLFSEGAAAYQAIVAPREN